MLRLKPEDLDTEQPKNIDDYAYDLMLDEANVSDLKRIIVMAVRLAESDRRDYQWDYAKIPRPILDDLHRALGALPSWRRWSGRAGVIERELGEAVDDARKKKAERKAQREAEREEWYRNMMEDDTDD